jgi:hypothetical protein
MANRKAMVGQQLGSGIISPAKWTTGDVLCDPSGNPLALAAASGMNLLGIAGGTAALGGQGEVGVLTWVWPVGTKYIFFHASCVEEVYVPQGDAYAILNVTNDQFVTQYATIAQNFMAWRLTCAFNSVWSSPLNQYIWCLTSWGGIYFPWYNRAGRTFNLNGRHYPLNGTTSFAVSCEAWG